jgi:hypothetical protein
MQANTTELRQSPRRARAGKQRTPMNRQQCLDLYFLEARAKLIDIAAFLDRVERAEGTEDFRLTAFKQALEKLAFAQEDRAEQMLRAFSDPTSEPLAAATTKGACGAWPGKS